MKKVLLSFLFLYISLWMYAQDVIVLKSAEEINAKVITVGQDEISYKKWEYLDGPTYTIPKAEVFMIKYVNGTKDVFPDEVSKSGQNNTSQAGTVSSSEPKQFWKYIDRVMFNGYAELGCVFTKHLVFPSMNFSFGARIFDYGYVGLGPGIEYIYSKNYYYYSTISIPILFSFRFFYPAKENVSPFLELSVGPDILIVSKHESVVAARVNLVGGIELKRFVIGLGYNYIGGDDYYFDNGLHLGVLKIGVKFGKLK